MSNTVELDKKIYLDHASTTPVDREVLELMWPYFSPEYGNPSSMHKSGRKAGQALGQARKEAAHLLNASPEEIIFTGSGTESDNLAILGIARAYRGHGNHIIISAIEHKAITEPAIVLQKEGFQVSVVPVNKEGVVNLKRLKELINDQTILVSIMYANNEIGTIEPIQEISKILKEKSHSKIFPIFHTDACQAAGALSLDVRELGVDLMTVNSAKIYGPKGVGLLYKKRELKVYPVIVGGEQEMHLRAGTENLPLIVGFVEALKKAHDMRLIESKRLTKLRNYFIDEILREIPDAIINGSLKNRLPNNVHISIPQIEGESILLLLDQKGVEASTGSACSAYDLKPSHVLLAIGQSPEYAHGSIRFSLGRSNHKKEIDEVVKILPQIVQHLKGLSALTTRQYTYGK